MKIKWHKYTQKEHGGVDLDPPYLLKLQSGEKVIVGEVNENLGVCDDCTNFIYKDIVEYGEIIGWDDFIKEQDNGKKTNTNR